MFISDIMVKIKVSHTIDEELVKSLDYEIKNGRFANMSHAIEYAIRQLISKLEGLENLKCIKRILTKKEKEFFVINSQVNYRDAIIVLKPLTAHRLIIPTTEEYGVKLTFKDFLGNEIPDETIIEFWKQKGYTESELLGQYQYKELKREIRPLRNQILISSNENLVIYVEDNYAKNINPENVEFKFAVDLCVRHP